YALPISVAWLCDALTLASSRPLRTWPITTKPSSRTTPMDISSVVATTFSWMLRRHSRMTGSSGRRTQRMNSRTTGLPWTPPWSSPLSSRRLQREPVVPRPTGRPGRPPARPDAEAALSPDMSARSCLVPDATDGHHDLRLLRVLLDLGAQPLDMHVHQPGVGRVAVAPDLLEQHLAGEHLPGLAGQGDQQVELQRGQRDRLPVPLHGVPGHVDHQVADGELFRCRLLRPAQPRADAGDQLLRLERLHDVVVGTRFEAHDDVDRVALGREHDDGYAGLRPDQAADLDAVPAGEHQVQQHQVGFGLAKSGQRLVAVGYERRLKTLTTQHNAEHLGQCGVVVDDKDSSLHKRHHPISSSLPGVTWRTARPGPRWSRATPRPLR